MLAGRGLLLSLRRPLVLLGGVALGFGSLAGLGSMAGAAPTTETFEFTGDPEPFEVPTDVCEITVVALGAQGGEGVPDEGDAAHSGVTAGAPRPRSR